MMRRRRKINGVLGSVIVTALLKKIEENDGVFACILLTSLREWYFFCSRGVCYLLI